MNIVVDTGTALFKRTFRRDAMGRFAGGSGAVPARGSGNPLAAPTRRQSSMAERVAGVRRATEIRAAELERRGQRLTAQPGYGKHRTQTIAADTYVTAASRYRAGARLLSEAQAASGDVRSRLLWQAGMEFRTARRQAQAARLNERSHERVSAMRRTALRGMA